MKKIVSYFCILLSIYLLSVVGRVILNPSFGAPVAPRRDKIVLALFVVLPMAIGYAIVGWSRLAEERRLKKLKN